MTRINGFACFFLVTLRLVIGWHFLVEGVHKIHSHRVGKTSTNTPWTGEGFFREGYGPAAATARRVLQLDDQAALARFRDDQRILAEWDRFSLRFDLFYGLTEEHRNAAAEKLAEAKLAVQTWLKGETPSDVKKYVVWGIIDLKQTVPQRLAEYDAKITNVADAYANELPAFNQDVEKGRLRALKTDAAKVLAELNKDLDVHTAAMKAALASVLTDEQKKTGPVPDEIVKTRIARLDKATMWAHAVLGGLLLIGLFTRLSSCFLAMFLLSVTLIAPAVPFAPTPPGSVGHYLYINLYTIEMIALLALTCMPTGKWFGLDALFVWRPSRRNAPKVEYAFPYSR